MGNGAEDKKWAHAETVADFSMSRYEVTVGEYKTFCTATNRAMPEAPYWGWNDQHPMVNVSYNDAVAYCQWLSKALGVTYRLPTEAEWEYAARAGSRSYYWWGEQLDSSEQAPRAHCRGCASSRLLRNKTAAVGQFPANGFGLHDTAGNVWEWCASGYRSYADDEVIDPDSPFQAAPEAPWGAPARQMRQTQVRAPKV